jgi:fibronectin type 3 domain-containing protein
MKRIAICLLIMISSALQMHAQGEHMRIIARQYADSVVLRWAPLNSVEWAQMNRYGYRLERIDFNENTTKNVKPKQLGPDSIRPYSLEKWKATFPDDHPWAPVAVQALFGKQFNTTMEGASSIKAQSQEALLRYSFALLMADLDAPTAQGLALRWSDTKLPSNGTVQYRLISLHPTIKDTVEVGIRIGDPIEAIPSSPLIEAETGDKSVSLRWDVMPENPLFTAFWLERSGDYGKTWGRVSERPIMKAEQAGTVKDERFVYFTDTLITENYKPYWYRLQGITPFAELSAYSPIQISMGMDKDAPAAPIMKEPKDVKGKIQVIWEYGEVPSDFKEFRIGKSNIINGPFQPIEGASLSAKTRTWIDNATDAIGENYYVVYALDTAGNMSASLPAYGFLRDSIAPIKPFKPVGSIDTTGVVRLHWKLGAEADIMGYRVYFSNSPDHEFSNKTPLPIRDTAFVDTITLNTLTKKIYYKIVAVDRNYNHSVYSDILVLTRPDTIRPVEPIFANYRVKEQEVQLQFIPSSSADVKEHRLMRRESGTKEWHVISKWENPEVKREHSDKSVKGAQYYEYTLVAIDSAGNVSDFAPTVDVRVIPKQTREQVMQPAAAYLKDKRVIELKWAKPAAEVDYYTIYRGKDGKRPVSLTTTDGSAIQYQDNSFSGKGKYIYMMKAIYKDKGESPLTVFNEVTVE